MRVLYFHRNDGVHDRRFLDALGRLPVEVIAVRLENDSRLKTGWTPAANVRQLNLPGTTDRFHWYQKTRLSRELMHLFQEEQIDVVHAGPVDSCAWLAANAGINPLVSMSWGYDLLVHADKNLIDRRRVRYALQRTAVLLDDCQVVSNKAAEYGFPSDRIVTFPWGVDLQINRPRDVKNSRYSPANRKTIVLISTRTMEKLYGCDVIIDGFIKAAGKEKELRLVMLGDGSQKPQLMQRIERAGIKERVSFAGNVPEYEMTTYFQASDIYISASHSDGSSVSLLQAMACGLPAVVSDIPGNREWVSEGRNGWLFKDGDSDTLAALMIKAAHSPQERSAFGVAARVTVVERADWQRNSTKLLEAYQMAIDYHSDSEAIPC